MRLGDDLEVRAVADTRERFATESIRGQGLEVFKLLELGGRIAFAEEGQVGALWVKS